MLQVAIFTLCGILPTDNLTGSTESSTFIDISSITITNILNNHHIMINEVNTSFSILIVSRLYKTIFSEI